MANFPGTNGYYSVGDLATAEFVIGSQWTVGCFFRVENTASLERALFGKWGATAGLRQCVIELTLETAPAEITANFDNSTLLLTCGAELVELNTWYFMGLSHATGSNGLVLRQLAVAAGATELGSATGTHPGDAGTLTEPLLIGSRRTGDHGFDGDICWPFYLAGKALSLAEMQAIVEQDDADRGTTILSHVGGGVTCSFLHFMNGDATEQDLGTANADATETGATGVASGDRPPDLGTGGGGGGTALPQVIQNYYAA